MMLNDLSVLPLIRNKVSFVKYLLSLLEFGIVWETQGVGNIEFVLTIFKQRVRDVFAQDWHTRLENATPARCYITITFSRT